MFFYHEEVLIVCLYLIQNIQSYFFFFSFNCLINIVLAYYLKAWQNYLAINIDIFYKYIN